MDIQIIPPDMILPGIAHGFHSLDSGSKEYFLNAPEIKDEPMEVEGEEDLENALIALQGTDAESVELSDLFKKIEDSFIKRWEDPHAPMKNVKLFLAKYVLRRFRLYFKSKHPCCFQGKEF